MQESGFTKSIPLICTSANWGKYSVFLHPEFPLGLPAHLKGFNHWWLWYPSFNDMAGNIPFIISKSKSRMRIVFWTQGQKHHKYDCIKQQKPFIKKNYKETIRQEPLHFKVRCWIIYVRLANGILKNLFCGSPNGRIWRFSIQETGLHVLCVLSSFSEAGEESTAFPPWSHSEGSKRPVACVP